MAIRSERLPGRDLAFMTVSSDNKDAFDRELNAATKRFSGLLVDVKFSTSEYGSFTRYSALVIYIEEPAFSGIPSTGL